jgi:hypothetical protein
MSEQRMPPSEQIRQQIDELLNNGIQTQGSPLNTLLRLGAQFRPRSVGTRDDGTVGSRLVSTPQTERVAAWSPQWL